MMEEPPTPSSEMWWRLMGDGPMSPRTPRTPLTPRTFASLWNRPETIPERKNEVDREEGRAAHSLSKRSGALTKQRRHSADDNIRVSGVDSLLDDLPYDEDMKRALHSDQPQNEKTARKSENDALNRRSPVDRITVEYRDRKLPTLPLSEHSKKRYSSARDDAFVDNASYAEGTTEKFLDILEDGMCSPSTPSICEIEKRIEESWKEIESKTSEFFRCRRSGCESQSNTNNTSSDILLDLQQEETKMDTKPKSNLLPSCAGPLYKSNKDDDDDDEKQPLTYESPEWKDSRDEEESLDEEEGDDEEDEADDDEPRGRRDGRTMDQHRSSRDRDVSFWKRGDDGEESTIQDTVGLNSYTDTYLKIFKERSNAVAAISQSQSKLSSDSTEYDASTLTTLQTESFATVPTIQPVASLDPPTLAPPSKQQEKFPRKTSKTKTDTSFTVFEPTNKSLTVYEPTNSSALLLQNSALAKSSNGPSPMRLPMGSVSSGNHYTRMPDLDPNFQRRCFSPQLGKKQGLSFGHLHATSTGSTEQSGKSLDSKGEVSVSGNHAYIAYFERGTTARGVTRLYEHPTPPSFPTLNQEIVVRVSYSTISHTDCAVRRGKYWADSSLQPLSLPIVPGVSFSGYVTQLNRGAMRSGIRYGDRVISLVRVGANARHVCIARDRVVIVPDELKDEKKLACLPEIYLGAFQVLHMGQKNGARYKKSSLAGKSILILGGATILGKALIELCHAGGAYAVYATGKERHFSVIEDAKATPVNRDPRHWYSLLKDRIDLVVGLDNESFSHSEASAKHLEILSSKGRAVLFGAPENTCDTAIDNHRKIFVYNVFDSWEKDLKQAKRDLSHLCKLLVDETINPQILETIPLSEVAHAQDAVEQRDFSSFLLCDPWCPTKREARKIVPQSVVYSEMVGTAAKESKSKKPLSKGERRIISTGFSKEELVSI